MSDGAIYGTLLNKFQQKVDLEIEEAEQLLEAIFSQQLSEIQMAALLTALAAKGESTNEIVGFARGMRRYAVKLSHQEEGLVDTAGTGGDGAGTFNISTTAAFVIAGAGVPVAKHGNRAISGRCGSADVLAQLGVRIDAPREVLENCLRECGITFLFAPSFHPAMRIVARVRKEMGIRTIFNLLGPLSNPANVKRQIIGVYTPLLTETFAQVLQLLGSERVLVFASEEGMDEISVTGRTWLSELAAGSIRNYSVEPEELGVERRPSRELLGGDAVENARILSGILEGKVDGAKRDAVLVNGAAGIYVAGRAESLQSGLAMARESLESRQALHKLRQLISLSGAGQG